MWYGKCKHGNKNIKLTTERRPRWLASKSAHETERKKKGELKNFAAALNIGGSESTIAPMDHRRGGEMSGGNAIANALTVGG